MEKIIFVLGQGIALHWGAYFQEYLMSESLRYRHKTGHEPQLKDMPELQSENGGTSSQVLRYLQLCKDGLQADVIVVGAGLDDIRKKPGSLTPEVFLDRYKKNLSKIISLYRGTGTKLVWMNTTTFDESWHNARVSSFCRYKADDERYHAAAMRIMKRHHVPVIELREFTEQLIAGRPNFAVYKDHVHFREDIRRMQALFVSVYVKQLLRPAS